MLNRDGVLERGLAVLGRGLDGFEDLTAQPVAADGFEAATRNGLQLGLCPRCFCDVAADVEDATRFNRWMVVRAWDGAPLCRPCAEGAAWSALLKGQPSALTLVDAWVGNLTC